MQQPNLVPPALTKANIAASAHLPVDADDVAPKTYLYPTAGAVFIMPSGERLQFKPVHGGGQLTTSSAHAQAELDATIKRGSQIRVRGGENAPAIIPTPATPAQRAAEALQAAGTDGANVAGTPATALTPEEQARARAKAEALAKLAI